MRKDNEQLSDVLQHEYNKKTNYYTHTEVPDGVSFEIDGYILKAKYPSELVEKELNNTDSFEGWFMVCRRWGVFDKYVFDWNEPADTTTKGYQDFLFRVKHFYTQFSSWFELSKEGQKRIEQIAPANYVCDKCVLESIIDIAWLFETGNKIKVEIPEEWEIHFEQGEVQMKIADPDFGNEPLTEEESQIYSPWQLLVNRWAYLPTSPKSDKQTLRSWDSMPKEVQKLIKVGFTERSFPYPSEY
ncbi:MAG: hypothetical protein RR202_08020 [Bacteroidales bacterium]